MQLLANVPGYQLLVLMTCISICDLIIHHVEAIV